MILKKGYLDIIYARCTQEEEDERSEKWKVFLEQQAELVELPLAEKELKELQTTEVSEEKLNPSSEKAGGGDEASRSPVTDEPAEGTAEKEVESIKELKAHEVKKWANIRPVLGAIENMMSFRVKKFKKMEDAQQTLKGGQLPPLEETPSGRTSEDDIEEEIDVDEVSNGSGKYPTEERSANEQVPPESSFPWKAELECLVRGGLPKDLRGEVNAHFYIDFVKHFRI